jgi:hypothetical protein
MSRKPDDGWDGREGELGGDGNGDGDGDGDGVAGLRSMHYIMYNYKQVRQGKQGRVIRG